MASEKQIQANRLNPVTHGFFSQAIVLPGEDYMLLGQLRDEFVALLQPEGGLEMVLVETMVSTIWRLRRMLRSEAQDKHVVDFRYSSWQNFQRYETTLERQFYRALRQLIDLQNARTGKQAKADLDRDLSEIAALQASILSPEKLT